MNHRAWDIYHLKIGSDNPKAGLGMTRLNELQAKGFTLKVVAMDELEIAEEDLRCHERFVDEILLKADIQHIYYPKPGMLDKIRKALDPYAKKEGTDNVQEGSEDKSP